MMKRRSFYVLLWTALLCDAGGCGHFAASVPPTNCPGLPGDLLLPPAARGDYKLDLGRIPPVAYQDPSPPAGAPYRSLAEPQVQCLASVNSSKANYLDEQATALREGHASLLGLIMHAQEDRALRADILHLLALEDRNQTAFTALQQYFRLIESEAKSDLVRAGMTDSQQALDEMAKARERGLKVPAELESLEGKHSQMRSDLVRLEGGIASLNTSLGGLLGMAGCGRPWRFRPCADLAVHEAVPDLASALAVAHKNRPLLLLHQRMQGESGPATTAAVRLILQSAYGVTGTASATGPPMWLAACMARRREADAQQAQRTQLGKDTERLVHDEVCEALASLRSAVQLVGLARARLVDRQQRLRDLEGRHAEGLIARTTLVAAQLEAKKLEADLVEEVVAWHVARLKLKQAQGLLVGECHLLTGWMTVDVVEESAVPAP